jgi:hypothetical protein
LCQLEDCQYVTEKDGIGDNNNLDANWGTMAWYLCTCYITCSWMQAHGNTLWYLVQNTCICLTCPVDSHEVQWNEKQKEYVLKVFYLGEKYKVCLQNEEKCYNLGQTKWSHALSIHHR